MRMVTISLLCLAVITVVVLAYIRLSPNDPARWHADPLTRPAPGLEGHMVRPPDALVLKTDPATLLEAFVATATAEPRVSLFAGSPEEGHLTLLVRSRLFGFPDFVSLRAMAEGEAATYAVLGRSRFGSYDHGTNKARIERWTAAVAEQFPGVGS